MHLTCRLEALTGLLKKERLNALTVPRQTRVRTSPIVYSPPNTTMGATECSDSASPDQGPNIACVVKSAPNNKPGKSFKRITLSYDLSHNLFVIDEERLNALKYFARPGSEHRPKNIAHRI